MYTNKTKQIYVRKLFPHDLTHEVSVTTEIVEDFFENKTSMVFYKVGDSVTQHIVTINNATDPRFGGKFASLWSSDNLQVGDFIIIKKLGNNSYELSTIKKGNINFDFLTLMFNDSTIQRHAVISQELFNKTTNKSDNQPLQQIFYGAPGTGKSHEIEQLTNGSVVFRTTFHPDSDYSTFVGAYKPIMREVPMTTVIGTKVVPVEDKEGNPLYESKIQYEFVPQAFAQAYVEAWKDLDSPVFLVIEEINRGNCAQIFGDIFQLLDRRKSGFSNYYIVPDEDLHQYVAKAFKDGIDERAFDIIKTGQNLCLPPNLYIWATMNTSDQSLFPIDSAFKRRWDWQYIPIEDAELNWKINVNGNKYDWWKFLQAINKEVFDLTLSEDKQLGYFFVQAKDNVIDAKVLVNKVFFYLWNDVFKDFDLDNSKVFRYADGPKSICFKDFYVSAGEIKEEIAEQILINLGLEKEA